MEEPEVCPRIEAFILVNTKPGALWKVAEEARNIPGVKLARCVSGRFDVIIHAATANLSWIIARVHGLKGVTKSETLLTLEAKFE